MLQQYEVIKRGCGLSGVARRGELQSDIPYNGPRLCTVPDRNDDTPPGLFVRALLTPHQKTEIRERIRLKK